MKVITAEAFRQFRQTKGFSQPEMAKYMGVSSWAIKSWEQPANSRNIPKRLLADPRTRHLATEV